MLSHSSDNYSRLGVDLLFDSQSHLLKKVILHTNCPAHQDFHTYHKCQFELLLPPDNKLEVTPICCDMKWEDIQKICGAGGQPMVHGSSTAAHPFGRTCFYAPYVLTRSVFLSFSNLLCLVITFHLRYPGCIFEVMRNGHIARAVLFKG